MECWLPYSGKNWQALNLVISAKTLYFLIWRTFKVGNSVPQPKYYVTTRSRASLPHGSLPSKILREMSSSLGPDVFGTIPSHLHPLLRCVFAVVRLASRWDRLGAGRAVVQRAPHTLVSNTNFLPGETEREESQHHFSGECTGIFLEVLVPASRRRGVL